MNCPGINVENGDATILTVGSIFTIRVAGFEIADEQTPVIITL